jgi:hypothetical protein
MKDLPVKTKIRADGLRYESKAAGATSFIGAPGATMSCIRCGRHVPRSSLESVRFLTGRQFRCRGGCC